MSTLLRRSACHGAEHTCIISMLAQGRPTRSPGPRAVQVGAAAGALAAVAQLQGQGSYRSRAWSVLGQVGVGTVVGIGAHAIFPAKKDD